MKYLLLISHGDFSNGLKQTLSMFAGDATNTVISIGLKPDEAIDTLDKRIDTTMKPIPENSQFVILADIIGGSPLTTVCNVLNRQKKFNDSIIIGGMNFPMALTAMMFKDSLDNIELKSKLLSEATKAIRPLDMNGILKSSDEDI
ncbi:MULTISPECIES: PTS sugar transporter subunit IIA [Lactobacillaceae]|uniref:PTS sugar transporter subunit IIA n=1 Tax=Lactobacillaceae TaxID=33958 RepID=UPI0007626C8A|nr:MULTISPECIES: PTS fructose transporter subunit IIA [Lactobacillaceae]MCS8563623.1 PTS fructose transporter subunit IIA [Pediococcus pentosaceus]MCS8567377.1 PTS fructose transporter subunit IIA [Pediococcus pentosaceus]MCS8579773.1 PTS fructose transporter subunit IIA [Pediococcus pentosaceus]MEC5141962.1 PTS fructose transporter subunit IIA [Pediococcus pentosaceus]NEZ70138.1 PTS fructose transporter subunit IIA [Pediococcus pentosaceus]